MKLSKIPHGEQLGGPLPDPDTDADLPHHLGLTRFTDAGFPWFSPVGQRLITRIQGIVRDEMERVGYTEFRGPAISRVDTVAPAGWLERFGDELIGFASPFDQYTLAATSEEPLLAYLGSAGLTSHRQLPMRLFEFREIFRFRDRPQGIYNSRQFQCCLFASLDADHAGYLRSAAHAQRTVRAVLKRLHLRAELVSDASTGGFEFIFPYARGDRPRSRTIPYHRDPSRPTTAEDDVPQGGIAMGYGYAHVSSFDVRFRDADNQLRTPVMGTYGLGVQRCVLALLEQHRTPNGVALPAAVRPFDVLVTAQGRSPAATEAAECIYDDLVAGGLSVVLDDRHGASMGRRMRFADQVGVPWRVVINSAGTVGLRAARGSDEPERELTSTGLLEYMILRGHEEWADLQSFPVETTGASQ
ncbi:MULTISPECIES: His/Gly/Thr/Pro-type tRNA ligase C-terminal domain-containing protein [unclassified Streptomyces]|uniref:His/Gly/Thr/Pro-type tRNA ligase C-terminal domain-containing protein n=1 Tax=unclassified Streptomyces TaxID=2593676 RepID=UPI0029AD0461|nr:MULTISPECIES: His/Gly/Thr/Pro-type tRNA ligase C-terminal domain-containing protein [unclassified Streptomyces]MDX3772181.1 His/Gly/Thr/Pro-type tRNA ligase C-terminal domain-containing protein [Streptomyces sp. AK08-01B]MDX3821728.1 His/Gly/Thr/Pro-type tRNA ligase C-terminal domain-containing protein [Streptomyces sp. AK08-01A]